MSTKMKYELNIKKTLKDNFNIILTIQLIKDKF